MSSPNYHGSLPLTPFEVTMSSERVEQLMRDVRGAKLPPRTFENGSDNFGVSHAWMSSTLNYWREEFDWRKQEKRINEVEQYTTTIVDRGRPIKLHFAGHFSPDPTAIPLLLLHGWPGSFIEFNSAFKLLKESTSPSFSVIVPSQLGYGFSDDPPLDEDLKMIDIARQMNSLMLGLGFDKFVVQGGDIGSVIARLMAVHYDAVQSININYMPLAARIENGLDGAKSFDELSEVERMNVEKAKVFASTGRGYGVMQGTRPSTISFVVQSSPVALLAWLGEKFIAWTDETPSLDEILTTVSLWWMMETFPKAIYPYRELTSGVGAWHQNPALYVKKPLGFSSFAHEIASAPRSWAAQTGNLQFYSYHARGGHFAAMERPVEFVEDMRSCFGRLWTLEAKE